MGGMTWRVAAIALIIAACSGNDGHDTTTTTDPNVQPSATTAARRANNEIRSVPDGYFDCDTTYVATSSTLNEFYVPEVIGRCILDAAGTGEPAQQSFYVVDDTGAIEGTIVRVDGPDAIVVTTYSIDSAGESTLVETECPSLLASPTSTPWCGSPW